MLLVLEFIQQRAIVSFYFFGNEYVFEYLNFVD